MVLFDWNPNADPTKCRINLFGLSDFEWGNIIIKNHPCGWFLESLFLDKSQRSSSFTSAAGSSDAVDVIIVRGWHVKIDNMRNVRNV